MDRFVKVTISLPSGVLDRIERERRERHETRSAYVRAAVEKAFREGREQRNRARYLDGYERYPESPDEIEDADLLSRRVLASEPWE